MILHIFFLLAIATVQTAFGTGEGGRKYRSLGRVNYNENSFRCPTEGFHPDARNCRTFYRCVDWTSNDYFRDYTEPQLTAFRFECGEGTVFDPDFNICNHPRNTRRTECGDRRPNENGSSGYSPLEGSHNTPSYPSQNGQSGYPEQERFPNESENQIVPINEEGSNTEFSGSSENCQSPGFYPVKGNCQKFIRCVNNGNGGYTKYEFNCGPGTVWDPVNTVCNYPSQVPGCGESNGNEKHEQNGYPGQGGTLGQGGYPGHGGTPGQGGYPGQGGTPGQGGRPGQGGTPGQGGYPGQGGTPGQGGRPGQGGTPGQGGYPEQGGTPGQGGRPGQGGTPGQGGYPGQGGTPGQGGRPGQGGTPGQGGRPEQENNEKPEESAQGGMFSGKCNSPGFYGVPGNCKKFIRCVENEMGSFNKYDFECGPGTAWDIRLNTCNHAYMVEACGDSSTLPTQEETPGVLTPGGMPGQGGYPGPGGMPGQGGYPGPEGMPGQGGYPGPGGMPGQGGYPRPGGMPGQGGYPEPGGMPGQGGYPGPGGMPGQGGYPDNKPFGYPGPDNSNNFENKEPSPGDSSECQNDGFYPVKNNCKTFFRCVNNGRNGYLRYDFQCGEGTVWDQENQVCNYPWAVARKDINCDISSTSQTLTQTTSSSSSSTFSQSTSYFNSSTSSQNQFSTSSTTTQTGTSQSQSQTGVASSSQTENKGSQTTSNQTSNQEWNQFSTTRPMEQGSTKPMSPQSKPTTENPKPQTLLPGEDPSKPSAGSSPCDRNKMPGQIKCEKAGFYPDPIDCSKFYRCVDWGDKKFSVYYFECGKGTIWDPALETCNYEKSVYPPRDCSSSGIESSQKPSTELSTLSPATEESNNASTTEKPVSSTLISTTSSKQPITMTPTTISTIPDNPTSTLLPTSESQTTTKMPAPQTSSPSATDMTTSSYQTEMTTSPTSTSAEATESTTSMPTSMTSSTDSLESSTKTDESSEMTTESTSTSSTEEITVSSTASQTETTVPNFNSEPTETTESTTSQLITTEPSREKDPNCPQLNDDQSVFVCPTGFKRHPKDCSLFYQCTKSKGSEDINIMILSCKNDTVYDERKIQCLPPEETESCQNQGQGRRVYRRAEDEFPSVVYVSPSKRLCPEEGSFAYEGDCTRFYKCKKDKRGKIQGYLYQCPENYSFYDITGRCEKTSNLPQCMRSIPEVTAKSIKWMNSKVPVDYFSSAFR